MLSDLTKDVDDAFPTGMNLGNPDFGFVFGSFGSVAFELTGGTHTFLNFSAGAGAPVGVSLATLGLSSSQIIVDFFAAYISDTNFASNESLPASADLNSAGNPGFVGPTAGYGNHNRFLIVPEPGSALLGSLGLLAMMRRRR